MTARLKCHTSGGMFVIKLTSYNKFDRQALSVRTSYIRVRDGALGVTLSLTCCTLKNVQSVASYPTCLDCTPTILLRLDLNCGVAAGHSPMNI